MKTVVDALTLKTRLDSGERIVLLDVRWVLGDPNGHAHYLEAHIPGAVYVDLHHELADPAVQGAGRHPLPAKEALQRSARAWGINAGDTVVAYDDNGNTAAARAWWLLRDAGVSSVFMLDGGLGAWRAAGLPLNKGEHAPLPGNVVLGRGHLPATDMPGASDWHRHGLLLDARAGERYRGELEPVDPRAGHIPGALSAPTGENLDATGRFLPPDQLRARFKDLGVDDGTDVAVYCGSGVTAAHQIAALEIAGFRATLYPGSFSQWSSEPSNEVAVGADPGGSVGE
ncbi:sulfurtransferase [Pseudarthrobacter sp. J75]|uniref:sulfurtransferase n=1 Tax=unclassified Pseudarthrobacter TaxID=2647000 RepID=UPI002E81C84C|nr:MULTISPECIES: sulfurtransferase [unclassified Pseudarthrobacter]MEE2521442.1 sulfurtransferase [Pseudarthrobacter sp. J47]MEE2528674.1 sulfurtransferase [Pseudarthrobacter sp. J75]MEE2568366.1 sulfurtransferase [Pseudarthrobacter sp. J64]